jgi:hypothetical protein
VKLKVRSEKECGCLQGQFIDTGRERRGHCVGVNGEQGYTPSFKCTESVHRVQLCISLHRDGEPVETGLLAFSPFFFFSGMFCMGYAPLLRGRR